MLFLQRSYDSIRRMDENYTRPVSRDDLLFTVEMALRKASRLWPKKRAPGDHDRLRPVAEEVVAYFGLCGLRVFERPKARGHGTPGPTRRGCAERRRDRRAGGGQRRPLSLKLSARGRG